MGIADTRYFFFDKYEVISLKHKKDNKNETKQQVKRDKRREKNKKKENKPRRSKCLHVLAETRYNMTFVTR